MPGAWGGAGIALNPDSNTRKQSQDISAFAVSIGDVIVKHLLALHDNLYLEHMNLKCSNFILQLNEEIINYKKQHNLIMCRGITAQQTPTSTGLQLARWTERFNVIVSWGPYVHPVSGCC